MKRIVGILIACILIIVLMRCGGNSNENEHEGEAKTPSGSIIQKGREYQDVIKEFEGKGFKNIKTEVLDDLITGWLIKDGEVESVSVDGDEDYSPDVWYLNDVEVIITYHTFPQKDNSSVDSTNEGSSESVEQPIDEPSEESNQKIEDEILTVENNKDLAILFANGEDVDLCKKFVDKYMGRTIEFDGNIAYMTPHENFKTRYDLLIYAGDYSEDSSNGSPAMQFKDVSIFDLHLTGDKIPETIGMGDNLHIIAIVDYIINNYLIILKPIATEIR